MKETLHCWARDPVEVVADLMGNPEFKDAMSYAPVENFAKEVLDELEADIEGERDQIFEEMASADWWKRAQVSRHAYFNP